MGKSNVVELLRIQHNNRAIFAYFLQKCKKNANFSKKIRLFQFYFVILQQIFECVMIQEIKIKNFLSFKDEVKFSFEASSNDTFAEESQVVKINENTRLLRFAIIYGYNASGKSNLLRVFDFLKEFWITKHNDIDKKTGSVPFKLDQVSQNEHSAFELIFYVEGTKYLYQLELDSSTVYMEKLSYYKTVKPVSLFERRYENNQSIIDYPNIKLDSEVKKEILVKCLKNMSFFAARNQVNTSIPLIDKAKDWLKYQIMQTITPSIELMRYAQKNSANDKDIIRYILKFLHEADFNITNIETNVIKEPIPEEILGAILNMEDLPTNEKERIRAEKSVRHFQTDFEHTVENERGKETYILNGDNEESRGTLRTFGLETALYNVIRRKAFLPIDEIETSIHPKLLEKILFEYLRVNSTSQLIVTTHNDGLLDLIDDLIRKDSVWFTEKQSSGVTDLYKLTDFRGVNRLTSIREAYRNKRFGATMK